MTAEEKAAEQDRIRLIQRTVAEGTTKDELLMFLYQAKKTGLDPLAKQIYIIIRKDKDGKRRPTIQASIDGLRLVAERSGKYAGQDAPEFEMMDGELKATVRVYKFDPQGNRYCDSTGVAYMSEYKPLPPNDFMWKKMPHAMLAKVAEALALRKAFPQDLSGIYTEDEMAQVDTPVNRTIDPIATEKKLNPPAAKVEQPAPAETPAAPKTDDERVLAGETVDEPTPADPPAEDPMIEGYRKKIDATETETGLKIIVGELESKGLNDSQKQILAELIQQRRQHLADVALGVK